MRTVESTLQLAADQLGGAEVKVYCTEIDTVSEYSADEGHENMVVLFGAVRPECCHSQNLICRGEWVSACRTIHGCVSGKQRTGRGHEFRSVCETNRGIKVFIWLNTFSIF